MRRQGWSKRTKRFRKAPRTRDEAAAISDLVALKNIYARVIRGALKAPVAA